MSSGLWGFKFLALTKASSIFLLIALISSKENSLYSFSSGTSYGSIGSCFWISLIIYQCFRKFMALTSSRMFVQDTPSARKVSGFVLSFFRAFWRQKNICFLSLKVKLNVFYQETSNGSLILIILLVESSKDSPRIRITRRIRVLL